MNATETIDTIHSLIETCRDGQEGFRIAAEETQNAELKRLFTEYSQQREHFADELQDLSRGLGDTGPEEKSSMAGVLHRGWMNLKAVVVNKDEHAILKECERGEDSSKEEYEKALHEDLPEGVRVVVQREYREVIAAHDRVRALRDARGAREDRS